MKLTGQIMAEIILDEKGICTGECGLFNEIDLACMLPYLINSLDKPEELKDKDDDGYIRCEKCFEIFGEVNHEK